MEQGIGLAPVTGKARIDVLDMLRGFAILGIFFLNVPFMAVPIAKLFLDAASVGWTPADQASWWTLQVLLEGTQRGLLQLLFGAGMMVLAARAMTPDGPVAVADLYLRRNLWLLGFGLLDIFVLLWAGDILHVYALAALLLFPFRKLGPKLLLALGLGFALFVLIGGGMRYAERAGVVERSQAVVAKQASGTALTAAEKKTLDDWKKLVERRRTGGPEMKTVAELERKGHSGGLLAYAGMNIGFYMQFIYPQLLPTIAEAFCVMLIGIALWKWGVIQGQRSARFYLLLMLACYIPGFALRAWGASEHLVMMPMPRISWFTQEFARIAVSIGHLAMINLAVKSAAGRAVFAPFKAAGRTAFSLYFMQQIIGLWILFAPWGPGLWDRVGWASMAGIALAVIALQLVVANLWVRYFANGPLEWAWRSLAYVHWQPFRRRRELPVSATPEPA
ncbi:MAG: DUF418 domain-containing protein [Sphingomonas sp.]|uniref:DUF418 domain-containing protein n=1 Tax=Sphingomonas sp. TaxID=28214 RepID=UPI0022758955|nr:DUF418 domain-containing protein [Sphingomonas sp.]MCX8476702.1 DUF418 domain-containing protein [Sphingomonas sp.]